MSETAVVYQSRYGSTARYAHWVADGTDADIFRLSDTKIGDLYNYQTILFGTPVFAGTLGCTKFLRQNADKLRERRVGVFTVGLSPVSGEVREEVLRTALRDDMDSWIDVFHLRGSIDHAQLSLMHRGVLKLVDQRNAQRARANPTPENLEIAAMIGKDMNFVDRSTIDPIIEWARAAA